MRRRYLFLLLNFREGYVFYISPITRGDVQGRCWFIEGFEMVIMNYKLFFCCKFLNWISHVIVKFYNYVPAFAGLKKFGDLPSGTKGCVVKFFDTVDDWVVGRFCCKGCFCVFGGKWELNGRNCTPCEKTLVGQTPIDGCRPEVVQAGYLYMRSQGKQTICP